MKAREIIKLLKNDGWVENSQKGRSTVCYTANGWSRWKAQKYGCLPEFILKQD